MSDPILPVLGSEQLSLLASVDPTKTALEWFNSFSEHLQEANVPGVVDLLTTNAFWRDLLAFTWDFRTFQGTQNIAKFLGDTLYGGSISTSKDDRVEIFNLQLDLEKVALERPYADLAWISGRFTFETDVGIGSGVFRLVPTPSNDWKAHTILTILEELKGFPELIGPNRSVKSNHGDDWLEDRKQELEFANSEPAVVVIGAGHCGLEMAARLQYLGVPTLVVDKHPRVGDSWRVRYDALALHDPIYTTHMPYLPFPVTWPRWTPAPKIADWLESYARILDLNVWNNTTVDRIDESSGQDQGRWKVHITCAGGEKKVLKPRHVIFATGLYGAPANIPKFVGMDKFKGKLIHTTQYHNARDHDGKKVLVVGACTSGHDMCLDHAKRNIDVTMIQRGSTYIMSANKGVIKFNSGLYYEGGPSPDEADRTGASYPAWLTKSMQQRFTPQITELDKELLEGLAKRGFKYNLGEDGSGVIMLYLRRGGGFYFDHGASQAIVSGKIKLKNDSLISEFTEKGIKFENGDELTADVIIMATGFQNAKEGVRPLLNPGVADKLKPVWSLNEEGELNSVFRHSGVEGLYFAMGNFGQARFLSKLLALQIKAKEEGLHGRRYSA